MTTIDPKLISLLAETDELFAPVRDWRNNSQVAAVLSRRAEFHRRGMPYLVGGSTAERIVGYDAATELERSGLVEFSRTKGKRSHWRLSAAEYWRLRWWSLLTGEPELAIVVRAIERNVAAGCVYEDPDCGRSGMVPEWSLVGDWGDDCSDRTRSRILYLVEILTPGFVFGWLDSDSDQRGAVYYRMTDAGTEHFANWKGPTSKPRYNATLANATADAYQFGRLEARRSLSTLRADSGDLAIPLGCGSGPEPDSACPPILSAGGSLVRRAKRG